MKTRLAVAVLLLLGAGRAAAQAAPANTVPPLKLTLDLGYINAAGNTNLSTLSAGENLIYHAERVEILHSLNLIYGRSNDVTVADQLKTGGRINFLVAKAVGVFVGAGYERNRFAGIAKRFEENAGVAIRLLDIPTDTWLLEVGGALNQQTNTAGVDRSFTSLRGATSLRHNFTKTSFLQEDLEVLPTTDNWTDTRVNNEIALVAPVASHVALKISYLIKFSNVPEPGFKKSDRVFTSGIQVTF